MSMADTKRKEADFFFKLRLFFLLLGIYTWVVLNYRSNLKYVY